ncbi:CAP domain-containing protein [Pseudomassariella vexata]|uniref:CAP domain-containing protein n=1 Tax=Pseudomassariella vexata TaxID=1141098 RepID=A0A1Y2E8C9_9PEZI|nr:CAP domain-containing protein [Pseudomassariella vexata]ORY67799.1 CAP domain-containing protein [Pseudomassariella vexata]
MPSWAVWSHNVHRANHSAPAMEWNETIAGYASLTADKCVFAHDMSEGNGGYGQNLAMWGTTDNPEALGDAGAIKMATSDMWYNGEFNKFLPEFYGQADPNKSDFESWGHFSQLLWVDSTGLGCSVKLCAKGTMFNDMEAWFMVCNYYPAGNFEGAYGDNVKKPEGKPVITSTSE